MCLVKFTKTGSKILFDLSYYDSKKIKYLLNEEVDFKFSEDDVKFFQVEFEGTNDFEIKEKTFYFCNLVLSEAFLF